MKAILIDPIKREINEIDLHEGRLEDIREVLECDLIDCTPVDDNNDLVFDDEFLYKGHESFFSIEGVEGQFMGKAIIVGVNHEEGEWIDPINVYPLKVHFFYPMKED